MRVPGWLFLPEGWLFLPRHTDYPHSGCSPPVTQDCKPKAADVPANRPSLEKDCTHLRHAALGGWAHPAKRPGEVSFAERPQSWPTALASPGTHHQPRSQLECHTPGDASFAERQEGRPLGNALPPALPVLVTNLRERRQRRAMHAAGGSALPSCPYDGWAPIPIDGQGRGIDTRLQLRSTCHSSLALAPAPAGPRVITHPGRTDSVVNVTPDIRRKRLSGLSATRHTCPLPRLRIDARSVLPKFVSEQPSPGTPKTSRPPEHIQLCRHFTRGNERGKPKRRRREDVTDGQDVNKRTATTHVEQGPPTHS